MSHLIIGCGYLGRRVARHWLATGHAVVGLTRQTASASLLMAEGITPLVADVLRSERLAQLPPAETVLCSLGYRAEVGIAPRELYVEGLRRALDALPNEPRRVILISSTGVYGDATGRVDEDSPCHPTRASARALFEAEQLLAGHRLGTRAITLRLAGLYGPGRIPNLRELRGGGTLAIAKTAAINLVHVSDAVRAVVAAAEYPTAPRTWVVGDGAPVSRREYYGHLATLLGLPAPDFVEPPSPNAKEFLLRKGPTISPPSATETNERGRGAKFVDSSRVIRELGLQLEFPSYREGLADAVARGPGLVG